MDYVIFAIIAYLLGSVPSGVIVGKIWYKKDIREHGSGNLGATNSFRVLGVKAGTVVVLADILKGTLATLVPVFAGADVYQLAIGLFAVIGHTYPVFIKFKGGKAVATSGGIILGVSPILFIIMVMSFLITLYLSKYVSLSSMVTGIISFIAAILLQENMFLILAVASLTIFAIYRHWDNIKRIKNKTEPKITWM